MLGYLANTIIFILVGVVIAQRAFSGVERMDWVFLVSLYFGIMVIRLDWDYTYVQSGVSFLGSSL